MNIAIIVAAGSGSRFSSETPKQFTPLLGKPLIMHTLERFQLCPNVDRLVLVMSESGRRTFKEIPGVADLTKLSPVVLGGRTRAESVKNALDSLDAEDDDIVAVHDGARPLVTCFEISSTLDAASTGAACLVAEVTDTIKSVKDGYITGTVDRGDLRRALTPQAFRYDVLRNAFAGSDLSDAVTDECYLVEKTGVRISLVEGSARNIKVTRPEDLALAEAYLKEIK